MSAGPTIYDIASRAGVGIATVSRVLNGSTRVAEPTRRAVQRAVAELGYRPNRAARRLAVRGPNRPRVAALMPFFSSTFYFAVSRPLSNGLTAADIDLVLHDVKSREDKNRLLDRIVAERSCEGLVLCSMGIGAERQQQFARLGVPVVCLDYPLPGVPSVTVDNLGGGELATRHLMATGSARLALISGPQHALAFRQREAAFTAVAGGFLGGEAPVMRVEAVTREQGRQAAALLLKRQPKLDGLVCVNDVLAVGALEELRARGLAVPGAVQLIGFDDQPLMDVLGLSTIRQPINALGEWAAAAMCGLLGPGRCAAESLQLPASLIVRATTRS